MKYFYYINDGLIQRMMMSQYSSINFKGNILRPTSILRVDKKTDAILEYKSGEDQSRVPFVFSEDVAFPVTYYFAHIPDESVPEDFSVSSYKFDKISSVLEKK